ncbi:MAG TPA: AarF/ABC1/UbiB kinase family protein [Pyrinomonadaceae bacterium]|nr:AarF/ABC1/UbiB kinase family protein [Chloracidobacterium sp.]MBP9935541.1 AarF/ABC1/UbiB kinase family protein [Pyrinomonadaceae bacterium]MBK7801174.1 AarF/ABC1/UbiB kinase family protein [Chloracidobacterium sp.]MBK9436496.1 AarF/ABC1/UbiB kinase family protein [Chloracidobacterium sp.]MBL0241479.1 AarF/ABC1/UbiB kinase family protein [Chloracidobacterium sp.]
MSNLGFEATTLVKERSVRANGNGGQHFVSTDDLAIAKLVTNKQLIAEEKFLQKKEAEVESVYHGWRGYWRLFQISRVIVMLAAYLYLDQFDMHRQGQLRHKKHRMQTAMRLTRMAVYGEKLYSVRLWFAQRSTALARRFVLGSNSNREHNQERQAIWLKEKLIELGPTFIKIGQSMGTRADLLPLPFVKELGTLVDSVPPFPNEIAFARIEHELGCKINEMYAEFELEPVAAASLGQVYRARLHTGEEVAVKVQRPNLDATIKGDLVILQKVAKFAERFPKLNENADWAGMLREFDVTVHEEMDYMAEGQNAERFRINFKNWNDVHVPTIYWNATTSKVMTMEFIHGAKVTDVDELKRRDVSPEKVNRLLIKTYLKQLLEDGFFHADPHPGNLLVMPDGRVAFFDFGMVGRITPDLQSKMIDAFFHVVSKDAAGIADDLIALDFLKPGTNPIVVKPVVEKMFEFHLNRKLKDVNFKELTYDLADVMYDYPFRLPSNFTYIMRALMTLEGIGIITDPEFNFFETAKPYAKEFMLRREGNDFRKAFVDKIMGRDEGGKIDWDRTWKLAKMAFKSVLNTGI